LRAFRSTAAIRAATAEQLALIVPKNTAQAVYDHFHPTEESEDKA
jgi:excinuclease ABC subunit C